MSDQRTHERDIRTPGLEQSCRVCGGSWPCLSDQLAAANQRAEQAEQRAAAAEQQVLQLTASRAEAWTQSELAEETIRDCAELLRDDIIEDDVAIDALVFDAIKRVIAEREDARRLAVRLEQELAASGGAAPAEIFNCTRCGDPISDGYMIGDGDGTGRRFAHPECYREYPGAYKKRQQPPAGQEVRA